MIKSLFAGALCLICPFVFSIEPASDSIRHYQIDEVTISTIRSNKRIKELPQKIEIIDQTIISSIPADNIADLLKKTTNLDIIQYPGISSSIGMRGFSPSAHSRSYTLLLINGVPSGTTNAASIVPGEIDRIEIVKGPLSALYGSDAMGGVINIITKDASAISSGNVSASTGNFGYQSFSGRTTGQLFPHTAFAVNFSKTQQQSNYRIGKNNIFDLSNKDKLILDKASYGDVMLNSKYTAQQAGGQLVRKFGNNWKAKVDAIYYLADDIETPGNYWGSAGQSKKDIDRFNLIGNLAGEVNSHNISFSPYFSTQDTRNYSNNSESGFVSLDSNVKELGIKLHDNINMGFLHLLVGADLDIHEYQSERFSDKFTPANPYQPDYSNQKMAGFMQGSFALGDLYLNAGARYDYIKYKLEASELLDSKQNSEYYTTINPAVGLKYSFPLITLKGSYGTGFSVPDAFKVAGQYSVSEYFAAWDFWWEKDYQGNPDLKPEKSSTIDLGFNFELPNNLISLDVTWFKTEHTDKIVEHITDDGFTTYVNADKSDHQGIEFMFVANPGIYFSETIGLEFYANFTYMLNSAFDKTIEGDDGTEETITRNMMYIRKSNGNFGLNFSTADGFRTRLNARYIGHRLESDRFSRLRPEIEAENYYQKGGYTIDDKILRHPHHLLFDWTVSYTHQNRQRFGISVSNLLDENYTEKDGYNMPGRLISGSFTYMF